jgi:hypothetical protein
VCHVLWAWTMAAGGGVAPPAKACHVLWAWTMTAGGGVLTLRFLQLEAMVRRVHGGVPCSLGLDDGCRRWCCSSSQGAEASGDFGDAPSPVGGVWATHTWLGIGA